MILIVTNRQDQTADYLIVELKKRGADFIRFNTEDYPRLVKISWGIGNNGVNGQFEFTKSIVKFEEITSIWFRRPVSPIPDSNIMDSEERAFVVDESRAAIEGIWRTLNCFWVSHPDALRRAEDKLLQLKLAHEIGFNIYPTLLTNAPQSVLEFYQSQSNDIIYKPLRHGRLERKERTGLIFTNRVKPEHILSIQRVNLSPSLFQRYVHKQVELRVTVIGEKVFTVEIHSQENVATVDDWRKVGSEKLLHELHELPTEIEMKCKLLVRKLDLEFGAIDMILTPEGKYVFLEINPNGQWAWIQQLCPAIPLRENLADLLIK
jgi:glutathione synthase/RimK-type ligase-like ATP-grasp enzyme